jgi:hypothetical protein
VILPARRSTGAATAATAGVALTAFGRRLGLRDALAAGPAPAEVVAARAGAALPYVREWLRSQAAAGYVNYDPAAETFGLAPGVAACWATDRCRASLMGWRLRSRWWARLDRYEAAFRTGEGMAWETLPAAHAEGMDMITRAVVAPALVGQWLPAVDGIVARLSAGAAVADVGVRVRRGDVGPGGHHGSDMGGVFREPDLTGRGSSRIFTWVTRSSGLITPILIEIEKPSKRWFRSDGRPSGDFKDARGSAKRLAFMGHSRRKRNNISREVPLPQRQV